MSPSVRGGPESSRPAHRRAHSGHSKGGLNSTQGSSDYFPGQRRRQRRRKHLLELGDTGVSIPESPANLLAEENQRLLAMYSPQTTAGMEYLVHHPSYPQGSNGVRQQVPLVYSPDFRLRFVTPSDIDEVKRLCREWFPIDYPDLWYNEITSNPKFFSVACVYKERIIGLMVSEIKDYFSLPKEDSEILAATFRRGTQIGYILSLGVAKEFRQNGIASFMLDNLISHFTSADHYQVRAVYLHVLTTNSPAIRFYERRGFKAHLFLPYYYNIKGKRKDGFTYVLYLNGGHPPWSALEYLVHCCSLMVLFNPWSMTKSALRKFNIAWYHYFPRLRQIAHNSAAIFS